MTNGIIDRVRQPGPINVEGVDRYPVNPDDFDNRKMIEAIRQSQGDPLEMETGASMVGEITQREDDKYVYYEIPINKDSQTNHELKVEVKNGVISISEILKNNGNPVIETNAERMFTIDPELDSALAEVLNEKDRVLVKIPKKRI